MSKVTIKQVEAALKKSGGFRTHAAKMLNISQSAVTQRINSSKHLQKVCDEIDEEKLDFSESKLMSAIKNGELPAIFFHLKCKGKKRGYIEKEITINTTVSMKNEKNTVDLTNKTQKELEEIYKNALKH